MVEIVAEFTTNHLGNLNLLLRMVDAAAAAGADTIKMQKKDVDTFYAPEKLARPFESPYGKTYGDYRRVFEFGADDFARMDERCRERDVAWFATAQDSGSFGILRRWRAAHQWSMAYPRYKVASSNARNIAFLQHIATELPPRYEIVLSVGGSALSEIETAMDILQPMSRVWLLHCVAEYPTKPERARLGNIPELKRRFGDDRIRIGYSGHEEGIAATLAAVDLGAEMIERHFCLSRHSFAHHIECSLEPEEFGAMVQLIRGPAAARHQYAATLPCPSRATDFGMTESERAFLVEQAYGNKFMGDRSTCGK